MIHSNTIPSRRIRRKDISKGDIVSQVVHTQIVDMELTAPESAISSCQRGRDVLLLNTLYIHVLLAKCVCLLATKQ